MRTFNSKCEICGKERYHRPSELKKAKHICCRECRSDLYKKYPEIVKNLDKGRGWNKGMSKANGDNLIYGKPRSNKTKKKISEALQGRKLSEQHKEALSKAMIELFDRIGRISKAERGWKSARWRRSVYKRDNYECQVCGSIDHLCAHHILSWKDYPKLRFELKNGITLCSKCHKKIHKGKTRNNSLCKIHT